jgi:hypothetical protein
MKNIKHLVRHAKILSFTIAAWRVNVYNTLNLYYGNLPREYILSRYRPGVFIYGQSRTVKFKY